MMRPCRQGSRELWTRKRTCINEFITYELFIFNLDLPFNTW